MNEQMNRNVGNFCCLPIKTGKGGCYFNTGYLACSTGKSPNSRRVLPRWYYIFRGRISWDGELSLDLITLSWKFSSHPLILLRNKGHKRTL